MPEKTNFIGRIGNWFKGRSDGGDRVAASHGKNPSALRGTVEENPNPMLSKHPSAFDGLQRPDPVRNTFLRPWAKRDAAIANLQDGFSTLTDLMGAVRDGLERSATRQDELLRYLSHLPEALQSIPEGQKQQAETLKAIGDQITQQTGQQHRVAEILTNVSQAAAQQGKVLDALHGRVENIHDNGQTMGNTMRDFGNAMNNAMADVSRTSTTSTQVLERIRQDIGTRDQTLERELQKQAKRFTTMLAISIFLAIAALVLVAVIGYLMLNHPSLATTAP